MPIISMMNEPEMPGRIMAQMAMLPVRKYIQIGGSLMAPDWKPRSTNAATVTPASTARRTGSRFVSCCHTSTQLARTRPEKTAAVPSA